MPNRCEICDNPIELERILATNAEATTCKVCQAEEDKNTVDLALNIKDGKTGQGEPVRVTNISKASKQRLLLFNKRGTNRCTSG